MHSTLDNIKKGKVIAVIRGDSASKVIKAVDALVEGGVTLIEVTFTNETPLKIIEACSAKQGVFIGAGTVLTLQEAKDAVSAGAKYLVSPCTVPEIVTWAADNNILATPGVFTPTEVYNALQLGANVIKLFPGSTGGIGHMKSLLGPFPKLSIIPTGGVDKNNINDWIKAGAIAVGLGTNLVSNDMIAIEDYDTIRANAAEIMNVLKG